MKRIYFLLLALAVMGSCKQQETQEEVSTPFEVPTMKMTTDIPESILTPASVETRIGTLSFFDGYPDDATTEKVYDNLDFMNGVQAFLSAMPGASAEGLYGNSSRIGSRRVCSPRWASTSAPSAAGSWYR